MSMLSAERITVRAEGRGRRRGKTDSVSLFLWCLTLKLNKSVWSGNGLRISISSCRPFYIFSRLTTLPTRTFYSTSNSVKQNGYN